MTQRRLSDTTVIITGGTAGVGRATARAFADAGASVGVIARSSEGLEATRLDLERRGARVATASADVADAEAMYAAATALQTALGPVDTWVNNAMVSVFSPVTEMTAEEFRRVTEVTYLGYVHGTLAALRTMRPRDRGSIVQVGSALAYQSIPLQSAYCAAKFAIRGFTDSLRIELRHEGSRIRLVMVQLPAHNTPQFRWVRSRMPRRPQPVPPIFQPEVAADAIVWASQHSSREMYVGGPSIRAILAARLAPRIADMFLARNGFDAQQTGDRYVPRKDNLWHPVDGMHDAHGVFDDRATEHSVMADLAMKRRTLAVAGGALAAGVVATTMARR